MRRRLLLLAATAALVVASSALAGGGASIASAPELPLVGEVVSTTSNIEAAPVCGITGFATEFYRVSLGAGDKLTVDYAPTLPNEIVGICILPPFVTDDTLDQWGYSPAQWTAGSDAIRFNAPSAGSWIMAILAATTLGYRLDAQVQKYTRATLNGPKVVHRRALVTLNGAIHGVINAQGDYARARMLHWKNSKWRTLGAVFLDSDGKFQYRWRAPQRLGVARLRVIYFGNSRYLPARATYSARVTAK